MPWVFDYMEETQENLQKNFSKLKEVVFAHRPVLREILEKYGKKSLFDFIANYTTAPSATPAKIRKEAVLKIIQEEVEKKLGSKELAAEVVQQMRHYYYVSTTDHYGPLYHPWVLNFNLVTAMSYLDNPDPELKHIVTLACSNVSLNNFSFPRGFAFTSNATGKLKSNRLSFLPSNSHSFPVYGFRAYRADEVTKVKKQLQEKVKNKEVLAEEAGALTKIIDEVYGNERVLAQTSYADQVTMTNYALWNKLVPSQNGKQVSFVYLEQEWIVARLLIEHHLYADTTINHLLFDEEAETMLENNFYGLPEAFSKREKVGTYLFWALPRVNCNHRLKLWKQGRYLVDDDGIYKVELTPDAIRDALLKKELIPSVLLTFMTMSFYHGLTCLGGLGQINYLPRLKEAYLKLQEQRGDKISVEVCEPVPTKQLGGEVTVALTHTSQGDTAPATLFDLLLHRRDDMWRTLNEQAQTISLEEAIVPMFPEDYPMVCPQEQREDAVSALSPKTVTKLMGLDHKIKPCAFIR